MSQYHVSLEDRKGVSSSQRRCGGAKLAESLIKNTLIYLASEPSIVYMENNSGEMKEVTTCNTYVYFDMESLEAEKTKLTQTIVIQMPLNIINGIVYFQYDT